MLGKQVGCPKKAYNCTWQIWCNSTYQAAVQVWLLPWLPILEFFPGLHHSFKYSVANCVSFLQAGKFSYGHQIELSLPLLLLADLSAVLENVPCSSDNTFGAWSSFFPLILVNSSLQWKWIKQCVPSGLLCQQSGLQAEDAWESCYLSEFSRQFPNRNRL